MEQIPKTSNRKKFLLWGAAVLTSLTVLKFIPGSKEKKKETVTMLTEDGKLVEVDIASLPPGKKKVTNKELQNWIKK